MKLSFSLVQQFQGDAAVEFAKVRDTRKKLLRAKIRGASACVCEEIKLKVAACRQLKSQRVAADAQANKHRDTTTSSTVHKWLPAGCRCSPSLAACVQTE